MQLDSDDLIARFRQQYPVEFELVRLSALVEVQAERIQQLEAQLPTSYSATTARPYVTAHEQDQRHE
jgi:hypothetical protein